MSGQMSYAAWSVCLCVGHTGEMCKSSDELIKTPSHVGPKNHVLYWDQYRTNPFAAAGVTGWRFGHMGELCNNAGRPPGAWTVGRHCTAGQYGYVPLGRHLVLLWILRCSCHIVILAFIIITAKIVFFAKTRAYVFINIHIYYTLAYIMCTEERWSWCRSSDDVGKFRWQCLPSLCHGTWRSYRWTVISLISSQPQWLDTRSRNRYIVVILVVYHWCFLVVFSLLLSCCYHSWSWRLQNFTFPIRSLVL